MIGQAPRTTDIRRFLIAMVLGVVMAVVAVGSLAYLYGPSGAYVADRVLLSPQALSVGEFQETPPGGRTPQRFLFDRIEYSEFDKTQSKWVSVRVSPEVYEKFWTLVAKDVNISPTEEEREGSFADSHPARLTIWYRAQDVQQTERPLQEVLISLQGDLYRVELRSGQWVFFHHPGIFQQSNDLFAGKR